ncbi:hypothetical protein [Anaeromonas frigoriresistens]|nr:hypothetical protein [Anaeromonas frigoriresistens]
MNNNLILRFKGIYVKGNVSEDERKNIKKIEEKLQKSTDTS